LGASQFGQESLPVASGEIVGRLIVIFCTIAPAQPADDHHSAAQGPAHLLPSASHTSGQPGRQSHVATRHLTQDVLAHGKHHRFGSIVALPHQLAGLPDRFLLGFCISGQEPIPF
jgi:hypothetical protein